MAGFTHIDTPDKGCVVVVTRCTPREALEAMRVAAGALKENFPDQDKVIDGPQVIVVGACEPAEPNQPASDPRGNLQPTMTGTEGQGKATGGTAVQHGDLNT